MTLEVSILNWLLALSPIGVVLVLMVGFKFGASRAGPLGWLTAFLVSVFFFGATARVLAYSQAKAALLALYVLYILWMALFLYQVASYAGAIEKIGSGLMRLTKDPLLQLLLLAWAFSGFLQGVGGFGVPIALIAPLLIGLGFEPVTAVAAVAVGHSWAVTFGSMATSFKALEAVSGLEATALAPWCGILLGISCILCGLATAHLLAGGKGLRHGLLAVGVVGLGMGAAQLLLATHKLWTLASFVAGLAGMGIIALVARLNIYRRPGVFVGGKIEDEGRTGATSSDSAPVSGGRRPMGFLSACSAYLILSGIVIVAQLVGPVTRLLSWKKIVLDFPALTTRFGFQTPAGPSKAISLFGHAGALIFYAAIISFFLYRAMGRYKPGATRQILAATIHSAVPATVGIISMVGFATIMSHCGMTHLLALGISRSMGRLFPVFSASLGALGAFMTGSNTNSNFLFAPLQMETAYLLGISVFIILAAQTTGGSLGSMLAPAKIIVGCSTAGLEGREGLVLRKTIVYGIIITGIIGALAWAAVYLLRLQ